MKDRGRGTTDGAGHHEPVARGKEGAGPVAVRREDKPRYFTDSRVGGAEIAGFASGAVNWRETAVGFVIVPQRLQDD